MYEVDGDILAPPGTAHPILLSYIDVVVQGYLQLYGPDGAAHFFATTTGWTAPIRNDRASPIYLRSQIPNATQTETVDRGLEPLGCRVT